MFDGRSRNCPAFLWLLLFGLLAACAAARAKCLTSAPPTFAPPPLMLDHAWMAVPEGGGPERALLEAAGFRFAPTPNRHEGQGTSSITIEFENGYFELISPDDSVPVSEGGGAIAKARFVSRMNWRTTRDSPFGIGFQPDGGHAVALPIRDLERCRAVDERGIQHGDAVAARQPHRHPVRHP